MYSLLMFELPPPLFQKNPPQTKKTTLLKREKKSDPQFRKPFFTRVKKLFKSNLT